jgi:hypothetical protein
MSEHTITLTVTEEFKEELVNHLEERAEKHVDSLAAHGWERQAEKVEIEDFDAATAALEILKREIDWNK